MDTETRLIVALDVDEFQKAKKIVQALYPTVKIFKVGSTLFTACGPEIIKAINDKGARVFLDLKFHDIPSTVAGAVESAARHRVYMLTVHAIGGSHMVREAVQAAQRAGQVRPQILGVTVLTSMNDNDLKDIGVSRSAEEEVVHLARLAKEAGADGVVASAAEILPLRRALGKNFIIVTPGIRPSGSSRGDQKRVATPAAAIASGADYIVMGRPIIEAADPAGAARQILKEIQDADARRNS